MISRGDDPPYPPMSAHAGLIAKTAIVSGPPARTKTTPVAPAVGDFLPGGTLRSLETPQAPMAPCAPATAEADSFRHQEATR